MKNILWILAAFFIHIPFVYSEEPTQKGAHFKWSNIETKEVLPGAIRQYINGEKGSLGLFTLQKGVSFPMHTHASEQFTIIVEGKAKFTLNGKDFIISKNEVVAVPAGVPHAMETLEHTILYEFFAPIRQDWASGAGFSPVVPK